MRVYEWQFSTMLEWRCWGLGVQFVIDDYLKGVTVILGPLVVWLGWERDWTA